MQTREIVEGNKLIAEFMNHLEQHPQINNKRRELGLPEQNYHTSWDWLMQVVEKAYDITSDDDKQFKGLVLFELGLGTPKEEVWEAVVDYINWYNSLNPSN